MAEKDEEIAKEREAMEEEEEGGTAVEATGEVKPVPAAMEE